MLFLSRTSPSFQDILSLVEIIATCIVNFYLFIHFPSFRNREDLSMKERTEKPSARTWNKEVKEDENSRLQLLRSLAPGMAKRVQDRMGGGGKRNEICFFCIPVS
jgi:hypothetical protein